MPNLTKDPLCGTRSMRLLGVIVAAGCALAAVSHGRAAVDPAGPPPAGGDQGSADRTLYLDLCADCHADDLSGSHGPPLTGEAFAQRWAARPPGELENVIRSTMPSDDPGSLTAEQAGRQADYLRTTAGLTK